MPREETVPHEETERGVAAVGISLHHQTGHGTGALTAVPTRASRFEHRWIYLS